MIPAPKMRSANGMDSQVVHDGTPPTLTLVSSLLSIPNVCLRLAAASFVSSGGRPPVANFLEPWIIVAARNLR
ncbi:unnamed protein product [Phytophthora lilii]|uniref:Unnamed protein product n=1 Tax=Phytophthora lilii TaxID=2077276 RepID=A0A9W7DD72_9STRA|nr:unnamed protein product [Phytophthora lilii]